MNSQIDRIAKLSPVEMRDIILNNPDLFPECEGLPESVLTRQIMESAYELRQLSENRQKKASFKPVFFTVIIVVIVIIGLISVFTMGTGESLAMVAGLQ